MTSYFLTIPITINEENTKPELRALTLDIPFYLIGISRNQV